MCTFGSDSGSTPAPPLPVSLCLSVSLSPRVSSPNHQVPLPSWPHSRDTLTVWKRHSFCSIQYDDDDDDSDDDEADQKNSEGDEDPKAQGKEQGAKGKKKPSPKGGSGDDQGPEGGGRKEGSSGGAGEGKDGSDGDDSDESHSSGSDDVGSIEGLPIGLLDVDMYAFVPEDEKMPCAQAAPCARFLLDP